MNSATRVASTSAVAALVLATVWLFWPTGLGGGTTYVTTHGTSMEPGFSTGDLAILSPADSYAIGDVVAYRSSELDTIVMHRIVSGDGAGFVTQGDNNEWLDADRPTQEQILGRLFLRIPNGGAVLDALRSPAVLLPFGAAVLALAGAVARTPRGRRHLRAVRRRVPAVPTSFGMPVRVRAHQVAMGAAAVTVVAAIGCVALLVVPTTETETRSVQVTEEGQYSYTGRAMVGTTYPDGTITTGDTVWNRLVEQLTVSYASTLTGPGLTDLAGTVHLDVVVTAPDGWSAVVTSGPAVPLEAGTATATVGVDAEAAAALLDRHYDETGSPSGSANLTVTPVAETTGTVEGRTFTGAAAPALAFALDDMALRPVSTEPADLAPVTRTAVEIDEVGPRSLSVLSVSVPIGTARKVAGAVLLLALAVVGAGAWIGRAGRGDVADRFLVRHADRILPVASFTPGSTVIDVSDAESLHRVAERFDTVVLHHAGEEEDTFAVRDVDATYRFVVPAGERRRSKPPVPAPASASAPASAPEQVETTGKILPGPLQGLWGQVA